MRIGINCSILSGRLAGIGYYVRYLIDALISLQTGHEWVLLGGEAGLITLPGHDNVRILPEHALAGLRRVAWEQHALPRLVKQERLDLLHCPDFSLPLISSVPVVSTIHDLSYYAGRFFSIPKTVYKRTLTRVAVSKSATLIAVSQFTRNQVLKKFQLDPDQVSVIYSGVEIPPLPGVELSLKPFVLFVGTLETRKNVKRLVEAFTALKKEEDLPHRLVLAGNPGRGWPEVRATVEGSAVRGEIDVLGYIPRNEIYGLYKSADLLVYPSFYEGFGLPVVEAMACGLPVICSSTTALRESGGGAALYFDPESTVEMTRAMARVLSSSDLRDVMRQNGLQHAAQFSWRKCATQHCQVYERVLAN